MSLAKSARIEVRVSPAEKEAWTEAAGGVRRISEWLRALANRASHLNAGPLAQEAPSATPQRAKPVTKGAQCARAHHHRSGAYCGTCKEVSA